MSNSYNNFLDNIVVDEKEIKRDVHKRQAQKQRAKKAQHKNINNQNSKPQNKNSKNTNSINREVGSGKRINIENAKKPTNQHKQKSNTQNNKNYNSNAKSNDISKSEKKYNKSKAQTKKENNKQNNNNQSNSKKNNKPINKIHLKQKKIGQTNTTNVYGMEIREPKTFVMSKEDYDKKILGTVKNDGKKLIFLKDNTTSQKIPLSVILLGLYAFVLGAVMLFSFSRVSVVKMELRDVTNRYSKVHEVNTQLNIKLATAYNIDTIRQRAENELYMGKPESHQIIYINIVPENYVQYEEEFKNER